MSYRLPMKRTQQLKISMNLLKTQSRMIQKHRIKMKPVDLKIMIMRIRRKCKIRLNRAGLNKIKRIRFRRMRKKALMMGAKMLISRHNKKSRKIATTLITLRRKRVRHQSSLSQVKVGIAS